MVGKLNYSPHLDWIESQGRRMAELVTRWANINSHTSNLAGLAEVAGSIKGEFSPLGQPIAEVDLPPHTVIDDRGRSVEVEGGKALHIQRVGRNPGADPGARVLLGIHMDTVYPPQSPAQVVAQSGDDILRGPGVADAKGGIAVMLVALQALERSPWAGRLNWEVFLNPDEEIGSPSSGPFLAECARRNDVGLVFEPALDDQGTLAGARRGSGNFTIVIRGRAAHAGRDFEQGRSAIVPLAELVLALHGLNDPANGVTVNVGQITGGTGRNVVPDLALARVNVRVTESGQGPMVDRRIQECVARINGREGISADVIGGFHCPPKPFDDATARLFAQVANCGKELGQPIAWRATGGVSDGNKLAAAGLPTVDSLGPCGGKIHSPDEYLLLPSLVERAQLTALLLMKLASGEIEVQSGSPGGRQ